MSYGGGRGGGTRPPVGQHGLMVQLSLDRENQGTFSSSGEGESDVRLERNDVFELVEEIPGDIIENLQ